MGVKSSTVVVIAVLVAITATSVTAVAYDEKAEPAAPLALVELPELVPIPEAEAALPPLIINSPDDVSVTQTAPFYMHVVSTGDFLVVDDGSADPTIECTVGSIANSTKTVTDGYSQEAGTYGTVWEVPSGSHSFLCTVTDDEGRTATDTHVVSVDVQGDLFPSTDAENRIKRIVGLRASNYIDNNELLLIIKYYHAAEMIDFDIVRDGAGGFTSHHGGSRYCNNVNEFGGTASRLWKDHPDPYYSEDYGNVYYKQCLEAIAERGHFDRIDLGF